MQCSVCNQETKNPKFCSRSCAAKHNNKAHPKRVKTTKSSNCVTCNEVIPHTSKYCKLCNKIRINKLQQNSVCTICGCNKDETNTRKQGGSRAGFQSYCKECNAGRLFLHLRETKQKCLEYRGTSCQICGYNKCNAALDFHHRNPEEKDFAISSIMNRSFDDELKLELDKCDVICSNCHRELHSNEKDDKYKTYKVLYEQYKNNPR